MSDTTQSLKDRFSAGKTPTSSDYSALIDAIPEGGGGTVDSAISSTSTNALQNRVLYNELRITETIARTVDTVKISGDTQPREIIVLDSNEFYTTNFEDGYSGSLTVYMLPNTLQEDKAYKILNSSAITFCAEDSGTYLLYFCDSTESSSASQPTVARYNSEGAGEGKIEVNYPDTSYWNLINFSDYVEKDGYSGGYVTDEGSSEYDWYHSEAVEGQTTITETSTKSLKQKIQELEARIAALES